MTSTHANPHDNSSATLHDNTHNGAHATSHTGAHATSHATILHRTLGELAKEQAERHPGTPRPGASRPGAPRRGRPSRIPATSFPLLISGKPTPRFHGSADEEPEEAVEVPVLSPAALGDGVLDRASLQMSRLPLHSNLHAHSLQSVFTQPGDVVVSLFPPFGCACVDLESEGIFVPTTFAVIRMDEETRQQLDPWYLVGYLSTSIVRDEVLPAKTSRRSLSLEDLTSLEILLPPLEAQRELGKLVQLRASAVKDRRALGAAEGFMLDSAFAKTLAEETAEKPEDEAPEGGDQHG